MGKFQTGYLEKILRFINLIKWTFILFPEMQIIAGISEINLKFRKE